MEMSSNDYIKASVASIVAGLIVFFCLRQLGGANNAPGFIWWLSFVFFNMGYFAVGISRDFIESDGANGLCVASGPIFFYLVTIMLAWRKYVEKKSFPDMYLRRKK